MAPHGASPPGDQGQAAAGAQRTRRCDREETDPGARGARGTLCPTIGGNRRETHMNVRKSALALVVALTTAFGAISTGLANESPTSGPFQFEPLPTSAACTPGGNPAQPLLLPPGYAQTVIAS